MLQVKYTSSKTPVIVLHCDEAPSDGAYRIISSNDDNEPLGVLVDGEHAVFFTKGSYFYTALTHDLGVNMYTLEPCTCTIEFS